MLLTEEHEDIAVIYLQSLVHSLDQDTLQDIQSALSPWSSPRCEELLDGVRTRIIELTSAASAPQAGDRMDVDAHRPSARLSRIIANVQTVLMTTQETNTDDMVTLAEGDLALHMLWMLHNGFPACARPPLNMSVELTVRSTLDDVTFNQKLSALKALAELPSLCFSCAVGPCQRLTSGGDLTVAGVYVDIILRFLTNKRRPDAQTRKLAYKAMIHALRHQPGDIIPPGLFSVEDIAREDLLDKDRGLRVLAGRMLVECIRLYDGFGRQLWARVNASFEVFNNILESGREPAKENVLMTVAAIGRAVSFDILGAAITCLISQLSNANPFLKGLANSQLLSLANHFHKSPYRLISPHMDKIAPYLVHRYATHQDTLKRFCELINLPYLTFIEVNLPFTLPPLFAAREERTLACLSAELGLRSTSLFLNYSEHVLAHIFLMRDSHQADEALEFILQMLAASSAEGSDEIDIQSVVKSCVVPLLALLVIHLGHEDENEIQAAQEALRKVVRVLMSDKKEKKRQKAGEVSNLANILRSYLLGIMTHVTGVLEDAKSKKTPQLKHQILRSIGVLSEILGKDISAVSSQIITALQNSLSIQELADVTLRSWFIFLQMLDSMDLRTQVGPSSAAMIECWPKLSSTGRRLVHECLHFLFVTRASDLGDHLDDVVDLATLPGLDDLYSKQAKRRRNFPEEKRLTAMLNRAASDNMLVVYFALRELKSYMIGHREYFQSLATGDNFSPLVGRMMSVLLTACSRESDSAEDVRLVAYECIGALGAVDPDRFEFVDKERRSIVIKNLTDNEESVRFAHFLISDVLVGAFKSTGIIAYQQHIAYSIQRLLEFCDITSPRPGQAVSLRARKAWSEMPKHVHDVVDPLLHGRLMSNTPELTVPELPIYPSQKTYREWLPAWTGYLITRASGPNAKAIFHPLQSAVRSQDVTVARQVLPHIVLNVLLSDEQADVGAIRAELVAVLEDQVGPESTSTRDKRLLSAQVLLLLPNGLSAGLKFHLPTEHGTRRSENRRSLNDTEERLLKVDSVISSIDQNLVAKAAFECKAYARSLMSFERHVTTLRERSAHQRDLQVCYERIHEIYSNIDEPDGMVGISSIIIQPSLEHQIREHESNGQWTSAQSCWELSLRQSPHNLECHKGLLQCLRHLGHYDTLRTHVRGILLRRPDWRSALENLQVEGAWMVGDWDEVNSLLGESSSQTAEMAIARVLVAMQSSKGEVVRSALAQARKVLGRPISAAGVREYRRSYNAALNLHLLHEVEMIQDAISMMSANTCHIVLSNLSRSLNCRLDATQPSHRIREPVLSMRRIAFSLSPTTPINSLARSPALLRREIGRSWLTSAKIARKAGHVSTAYSALLQARHHQTPYAFIQAAKLTRASGEHERALRDLEHSLSLVEQSEDVIDLTEDNVIEEDDRKMLKAKAHLLLCRWMTESDSYQDAEIQKYFNKAAEIVPRYESATFYFGKFHNDCYKTSLGLKLLNATARCFLKALRYGSKFTYQMVPRLLMIWMDMGEETRVASSETYRKMCAEISRAIPDIPAYKWYTAFPQIASRVGHSNLDVWKDLAKIIKIVIREYPQQGMWQFASVMKSKNQTRRDRGKEVLTQLMAGYSFSAEASSNSRKYSLKKDFPGLHRLAPSCLIIPLQESLIASLPPTSSGLDVTHKPFPVELPRFHAFKDEIDVMRSLAKPRKITIVGDDQRTYMFLGKPKDDLRKDARLMDFNALINKLLKANSDSRRRQLHIRTYGVVTLNEECGFIQWVPKTVPIRPVLVRSYEARGIKSWSADLGEVFNHIKASSDKDGGKTFLQKVLPQFPPVFHEWFIETFPEPSVWLASRLTYGRTAAVMSMVGFILGLGDRHCENILMDEVSGAVVHVDFNCLFEKGKTLETPERVPFRLTQNLVDGLGITGVEGVFRIACEITMQILRDNRDTLMTVLDAFIHDPLVEWEDERKRIVSDMNAIASLDMKQLARNALEPIKKKLSGIYATNGDNGSKEREISTTSLVQTLIHEATDECNLGKMYPGWAPWH
ncbi:hypothetical protein K488DRAFT_78188 [Vararia minispora EC-137]|uniref:Uncharacterized protein n=1 Tax=Vararia minispora EC-137 TaxID=1314806 RepID=A0ACB8QMP7_9AGAM|nr:hypothetical protein K488DRAFT_78188 [Vararia minispora EC-137]